MDNATTIAVTGDMYFVYDGDCPVCKYAAHALRIRRTVGQLHLINAREQGTHPLLLEVNAHGYDLDEGMVIHFGGRFYHGADALVMMALLGSGTGSFNRMNALVFRSPAVARLVYPPMRGLRNLFIRIKGIPKIRNLTDTPNTTPV